MPAVEHVTDITRTIQLAVAPVFLLTALGTMLSVFSTRLGRIVDRARVLGDRAARASRDEHAILSAEVALLARRRHLVNRAITFGTTAALLMCMLIALSFLGALLKVNTASWVAGLFIATMAAFIAALISFLREILIAVTTVELAIPGRLSVPPDGRPRAE